MRGLGARAAFLSMFFYNSKSGSVGSYVLYVWIWPFEIVSLRMLRWFVYITIRGIVLMYEFLCINAKRYPYQRPGQC